MSQDKYLKFLSSNSKKSNEYYAGTYNKSEQQKKLEKLLESKNEFQEDSLVVGDFGCGGGSLSFYLNQVNPKAHFELIDYNNDAVEICKKNLSDFSNIHIQQGNLEEIAFGNDYFDYIFCWQTISWLTNPEKVIKELVRVLKPGGKLYISALANVDHDVDLRTEVTDFTRGENSPSVFYNTFSSMTLNKWIGDYKTEYFKFVPEADFFYEGRGLGSFTVDSVKGKIQISGGMLMNWYFIRVEK